MFQKFWPILGGMSWRRSHVPAKRVPRLARHDVQPRKAAVSFLSKKFELVVTCRAELQSSPMLKALWEGLSPAGQVGQSSQIKMISLR